MRRLLLLGVLASVSWAHQLIVDSAWSGDTLMLTAFYADGKPARKASFVVRSVDGAELARLLANEQGCARTVVRGAESLVVETIHYSHRQPGLGVAVPSRADSTGAGTAPPHARAVATPWARLLLGLAVLLVVGVAFAWRNRQLRGEQP